jgi:hypothetical protein
MADAGFRGAAELPLLSSPFMTGAGTGDIVLRRIGEDLQFFHDRFRIFHRFIICRKEHMFNLFSLSLSKKSSLVYHEIE